MKKSIVHVNQHILRANMKNGADAPMLTCKQGGGRNTYAHEVEIHGPSRFIYSVNKPLSCGARVWLQTESDVSFRNYDDPALLRKPSVDTAVIRVSAKAIRNNLQNSANEPVLFCVRGTDVVYAHELAILGPAKIRTANMALDHEVSIWVETQAQIGVLAPLPNGESEICALFFGRRWHGVAGH